MDLSIRPICVGTLTEDKSLFTYLMNFGVKIEIPVLMWYIEGAEKRVLVDTGCCTPAWSREYHMPVTQTKDQEPLNALRRNGIMPEDIDIVILSHLHWDHSSNNGLFKNATFLVQKKELEYAASPLPVHLRGYEAPQLGMRPHYLGVKFTVIDGDHQVVPGVSIILTPGHSPGSQCVTVDTREGTYVIAADTVPLYENWAGKPPLLPHIASGIHVGLVESYESFKKIELVADSLLPGHDPAVLQKERYPD